MRNPDMVCCVCVCAHSTNLTTPVWPYFLPLTQQITEIVPYSITNLTFLSYLWKKKTSTYALSPGRCMLKDGFDGGGGWGVGGGVAAWEPLI